MSLLELPETKALALGCRHWDWADGPRALDRPWVLDQLGPLFLQPELFILHELELLVKNESPTEIGGGTFVICGLQAGSRVLCERQAPGKTRITDTPCIRIRVPLPTRIHTQGMSTKGWGLQAAGAGPAMGGGRLVEQLWPLTGLRVPNC